MFRARIALVAVLFTGSLGFGASCNRANTGAGGNSTPTSPDVRNDPATGQGSAADPPAVTSVQGLDLASLSASERELFWQVANDALSPCGDPANLAVCARDRTCGLCLPALRFLSRRVSDGHPREQLGELVAARYDRRTVSEIRMTGAASRGPATAPVTVVEFSDYECPHCGRAAPVLRDIERQFEGRVRIVHMHFPLSGHTHAMPASRAAVAAGRQNKFWEFHDLLFANQQSLEPADLDRYATQVGLDLTRFHADMASPDTEAFVASNRREGERLQIDATPTIFVNGRRWPAALPFERTQLREWVQEEIDNPTTGNALRPGAGGAAAAPAAAPAAH